MSPASERPKARQDTQPFVPDTVRMSGLAVPVGVPSQARSTPLPKPAPSSLQAAHIPGKKKKRESSLLGLIVPSLGRRGGSAPRPPEKRLDRTLDVSETDLSLVESSTTELTLSDLSGLSDMPRADASHEPPPPLPRSPFRRQNPWLVWGLVGGAWCVMIALALLAVDDEPAKQPLRAEHAASAPVEQVGASAPENAHDEPALAVSTPATLAPGKGPVASAEAAVASAEPPAPSVPEAGSAASELTPPAALVGDSASDEDSKHKARAHKRSERQKKAAALKRKRAKRARAAKRAAAAAQE